MIKSITVINHLGDKLKMELTRPDLSGFIVKTIDGLGPVKAKINTVQSALHDGSTYNSSYLDQRNIVLNIEFYEWATESIEELRHKSYHFFPQKKLIKLVIETDTRTLETEGYVESNEPDIFSKNEGSAITILCPDPNLYSSDNNVTVFSGVVAAFESPIDEDETTVDGFSNESLDEPMIEFGAIYHKTENYIRYDGDMDTGMTIEIHALGPASNITIYNLETREKMHIDTTKLIPIVGSEIKAGDTITIVSDDKHKSITLLRDGVKSNIFNCLDRDSDWFMLTKGDNVFAYVTESGSENLQFRIINRLAYGGI